MHTIPSTAATRPPFWRDIRVLRVGLQILALAAVALLLYVLWFNLTTNLRAQGIRTDFRFLDQPAGVPIADSPIGSGSTIRRALGRGLQNTFALVVVGLPLLTVIGVLVGIARLSTNWLVSKAATLYVEVFRNLPPLLIIVFGFLAVVLKLPPARAPATPLGWFAISNLRISVPGFVADESIGAFWLLMVGAIAAAAAVAWWRTKVFERTGRPHRRLLWSIGLIVVAGLAAFVATGRPISMSLPSADGRLVTGGFSGLGAYFAVMGALVLYTASHVAEIVRGSVQAVPKGQTEAANALALTGFQRLRYVTLPQAMRIALPPIINQYLNYTKNTSLAIAVAFAEVTTVAFQAIGNGHPAPQLILTLMAAYLVFSLTISFLVNILNRRLQLVTR